MGNKGAVITSLRMFDSIFKFCGCHLAAGSGPKDLDLRIDNLNTIIMENFSSTSMANEDFWFILGDLNFRVCAATEEVTSKISKYKVLQNQKKTGHENSNYQQTNSL